MTAAARTPLVLGVLASGTGSNLGAILAAIEASTLRARVGVVISNVDSAGALEKARSASVPAVVLRHKEYASREAFDAAVVDVLRAHGATCVVLAGFMRIVTPVLLDAFPDRIVNIHPSLLPAFPGVGAQAQAIRYGVKISGCTVHLVDAGMDTGPVIAQRAVPVLDGDDEASLRARILEQEHQLLPEVLGWIADERLDVVRDEGARPRVVVTGRGERTR